MNDEIYNQKGLSILSLDDSNTIEVGDDVFSLNEQGGSTLASGSIATNDVVKMKLLANVEGNGAGTDIVNPISWAGFEFSYFRFNENPDTFCVLSPFGSTTVNFYLNGAFSQSGVVDESGTCFNGVNYGTNDNVYINSTLFPVIIHYNGRGSQDRDAFVLYPMTKTTFFGSPARSLRIGSGPLGATAVWYDSLSAIGSFNLGAFSTGSRTGIGANDGVRIPAHKIVAGEKISVFQDNDGDGSEISVIVPEYEMSTRFGSNEPMDYLLASSAYPDANCSIYDSAGILIDNQINGGGANGVYNYTFGNTGADVTYLTSRWKFECEKPVWLFVERATNDETNLFGYLQMRQYVYPEPLVSLS